jgi:hypothetical protein
VLDNFYDSAEISSGGHVWSNAAIGTDYLERTWQQGYRGSQRTYDSEGMVADGNPLLQRIPDVSDPASGYIWNNLAGHGKTYYHFAEYISSTFCNAAKVADPQAGAMLAGGNCPRNAVAPGETFPAEQMALACSSSGLQHCHQARISRPLRRRSSGLQPHDSRPGARGDFPAPLAGLDRRQAAG